MNTKELREKIERINPKETTKGKAIGVKSQVNKTLTEKQKAFCSLICQGHSPSDAYRKAYDVKEGTKSKTVTTSANKLKKKPAISAYLETEFQRQTKVNLENQTELRQKVVQELFRHSTESANEHIQVRALELLGKASGLFVERQEITTKVTPDKLKRELERTLESFDTSKSTPN